MSELIQVESLNAVDVYNGGGLKDVINLIRDKVGVVGLDMTKKKDRDLVRSNAANVAKAKTKLDALGKELTEDWKAKSKAVDISRKAMREELDALKEDVRAPLTEYENREKDRVAKLDQFYDLIVNLGKVYCDESQAVLVVSELEGNLQQLNEMVIDETLQERELDCIKAHKRSTDKLTQTIIDINKKEQEARELEVLRIERAKKEQEERERKIAEEAAEQAREQAARVMMQQQQEAEAREARAKQAAIDAEEKAKREAEQAELRLKQQAEQAEREKKAAIEVEKQRQQAEELRIKQEAEAREANKAHKKKINNEAMQCFIDGGLSEEDAKLAVTLLAKRVIKHAEIKY